MGVGVLMNLIDISSHQAGIDLATMFDQNPLDGVIVKSTQGMGYVNTPYCDKWIQWLIKNNKPWGFYHWIETGTPEDEAKYFIKHTENYWGHGVPFVDYEADDYVSTYGTYYLKRFLDTCYAETGIKPLVYCNQSTIASDTYGFQTIVNEGYKLWLAQYTGLKQIGFRTNPWRLGSVRPWEKETIHQYTNLGVLNGWSKNLDLDLFYGTAEDWQKLAEAEVPTEDPTEDPVEDNVTKAIALLEQAISLLRGA